MFIKRSDVESDGCPANRVYCSASGSTEAIVGSSSHSGGDPMDSAPTTSDTPPTSYVDKPGMHRYIGIVMVIVLFFVVLVGWIWYSQRRKHKRALARRKAELGLEGEEEGGETTLGEKEELSNNKSRPITPVIVSEKDRSLMLQSEPRGVIKEVSGGVVMFTEAPKAHPGKDRYPLDLELEHTRGDYYEPKHPRRYSGRSPTTPNRTSSR